MQPQGWLRDVTRLPNWERHLTALIRRSRNRPFKWGSFDCCGFAADGVVAVAGFDPFLPWRGKYGFISQASALVDAAGGNLLSAARAHLDWLGIPEVSAITARTGDIGAWMGQTSAVLGVIASERLAIPQAVGLAFVPLDECETAWRVG